ncbi:MAG: alpha/beta hydrolase [Leptolyngbya sp. Prado105]|nr:alpha/beta hydrolase [Leptolyngbya sp. Prado105]
MTADFPPPLAAEIRDEDAVALFQQLQQRVVQIPFESGAEIQTTYVHAAPECSVSRAALIVLLAGFDSSLLEFRRLFSRLATQHETWAIDLLGFGFTQAIPLTPVNPISIRHHLLKIVQTWIDQPVILVGASLGGAVAIDFALHHLGWVRLLVLIDSVGFSGSFPIGQFLPRSLLELGADWLRFRKSAALSAALTLPMMNSGLVDALRCSLLQQAMPGWKEALVSFSQSGGYADLGNRISQIQHQTLII